MAVPSPDDTEQDLPLSLVLACLADLHAPRLERAAARASLADLSALGSFSTRPAQDQEGDEEALNLPPPPHAPDAVQRNWARFRVLEHAAALRRLVEAPDHDLPTLSEALRALTNSSSSPDAAAAPPVPLPSHVAELLPRQQAELARARASRAWTALLVRTARRDLAVALSRPSSAGEAPLGDLPAPLAKLRAELAKAHAHDPAPERAAVLALLAAHTPQLARLDDGFGEFGAGRGPFDDDGRDFFASSSPSPSSRRDHDPFDPLATFLALVPALIPALAAMFLAPSPIAGDASTAELGALVTLVRDLSSCFFVSEDPDAPGALSDDGLQRTFERVCFAGFAADEDAALDLLAPESQDPLRAILDGVASDYDYAAALVDVASAGPRAARAAWELLVQKRRALLPRLAREDAFVPLLARLARHDAPLPRDLLGPLPLRVLRVALASCDLNVPASDAAVATRALADVCRRLDGVAAVCRNVLKEVHVVARFSTALPLLAPDAASQGAWTDLDAVRAKLALAVAVVDSPAPLSPSTGLDDADGDGDAPLDAYVALLRDAVAFAFASVSRCPLLEPTLACRVVSRGLARLPVGQPSPVADANASAFAALLQSPVVAWREAAFAAFQALGASEAPSGSSSSSQAWLESIIQGDAVVDLLSMVPVANSVPNSATVVEACIVALGRSAGRSLLGLVGDAAPLVASWLGRALEEGDEAVLEALLAGLDVEPGFTGRMLFTDASGGAETPLMGLVRKALQVPEPATHAGLVERAAALCAALGRLTNDTPKYAALVAKASEALDRDLLAPVDPAGATSAVVRVRRACALAVRKYALELGGDARFAAPSFAYDSPVPAAQAFALKCAEARVPNGASVRLFGAGASGLGRRRNAYGPNFAVDARLLSAAAAPRDLPALARAAADASAAASLAHAQSSFVAAWRAALKAKGASWSATPAHVAAVVGGLPSAAADPSSDFSKELIAAVHDVVDSCPNPPWPGVGALILDACERSPSLDVALAVAPSLARVLVRADSVPEADDVSRALALVARLSSARGLSAVDACVALCGAVTSAGLSPGPAPLMPPLAVEKRAAAAFGAASFLLRCVRDELLGKGEDSRLESALASLAALCRCSQAVASAAREATPTFAPWVLGAGSSAKDKLLLAALDVVLAAGAAKTLCAERGCAAALAAFVHTRLARPLDVSLAALQCVERALRVLSLAGAREAVAASLAAVRDLADGGDALSPSATLKSAGNKAVFCARPSGGVELELALQRVASGGAGDGFEGLGRTPGSPVGSVGSLRGGGDDPEVRWTRFHAAVESACAGALTEALKVLCRAGRALGLPTVDSASVRAAEPDVYSLSSVLQWARTSQALWSSTDLASRVRRDWSRVACAAGLVLAQSLEADPSWARNTPLGRGFAAHVLGPVAGDLVSRGGVLDAVALGFGDADAAVLGGVRARVEAACGGGGGVRGGSGSVGSPGRSVAAPGSPRVHFGTPGAGTARGAPLTGPRRSLLMAGGSPPPALAPPPVPLPLPLPLSRVAEASPSSSSSSSSFEAGAFVLWLTPLFLSNMRRDLGETAHAALLDVEAEAELAVGPPNWPAFAASVGASSSVEAALTKLAEDRASYASLVELFAAAGCVPGEPAKAARALAERVAAAARESARKCARGLAGVWLGGVGASASVALLAAAALAVEGACVGGVACVRPGPIPSAGWVASALVKRGDGGARPRLPLVVVAAGGEDDGAQASLQVAVLRAALRRGFDLDGFVVADEGAPAGGAMEDAVRALGRRVVRAVGEANHGEGGHAGQRGG